MKNRTLVDDWPLGPRRLLRTDARIVRSGRAQPTRSTCIRLSRSGRTFDLIIAGARWQTTQASASGTSRRRSERPHGWGCSVVSSLENSCGERVGPQPRPCSPELAALASSSTIAESESSSRVPEPAPGCYRLPDIPSSPMAVRCQCSRRRVTGAVRSPRPISREAAQRSSQAWKPGSARPGADGTGTPKRQDRQPNADSTADIHGCPIPVDDGREIVCDGDVES